MNETMMMGGGFSASASLFLAATSTGLRVFDSRTGLETEQSPLVSDTNTSCQMVCTSSDGKRALAFFINGPTGSAVLYTVDGTELIKELDIPMPRTGQCLNLEFSLDSSRFFFCLSSQPTTNSYFMVVFDDAGSLLLNTSGSSYRKSSVVGGFSKDSRFFVYEQSSLTGDVRIIDLNEGGFSTLRGLSSGTPSPALYAVLTHPVTGDMMCVVVPSNTSSSGNTEILYIENPTSTSPTTRSESFGIDLRNYSFCGNLGFQSFLSNGTEWIYGGGDDRVFRWEGYSSNLIRGGMSGGGSTGNSLVIGASFQKRFNTTGDIFTASLGSSGFVIFDKNDLVLSDPFISLNAYNNLVPINATLVGPDNLSVAPIFSNNNFTVAIATRWQNAFAIT